MATIEKNKSKSAIISRYKFQYNTMKKYKKGKWYYIKSMGGGSKPRYYTINVSNKKPNVNNIVVIQKL